MSRHSVEVMSAEDRGESQLTRVLLKKFNHCLKDAALKLPLRTCKQIVCVAQTCDGQKCSKAKGHVDTSMCQSEPFECLANDAKNEYAVQLVGGQFSSILYTSRCFLLSLQLFSSQPKSRLFFNKPLPLNSEASLKLSAADFLSSCSLQLLISLICLSHQSSWLQC